MAYAKIGVTLKFVHKFSCEIKPSVQEWILGLHKAASGLEGCLFEDAADMGAEFAKCKVHG
eukprot:11368803-Karenia_brevis.AAC.1